MAAARIVGRSLHLFQAGECSVVHAGVARAPFDELVQLAQLVDAERRLNVAQVVLEAVRQHVVVPGSAFGVAVPRFVADTVQREHPHGLRQLRRDAW